ncbi:SIMPL domain-containing protein [Erythrobacter crassostreae]|uniref:SIMPL domain-containing protein n=1 Tax=Erythrobacter crassostreae TaxID=2828328 RepID=A0A9X1F3L0_9SPHN|nr:SIMPL domain-containing protein [Erythrobacter crassostrea]MBV7259632.1 SIMPL domain-containing protein [Erythrobacter crassostrea]
MKFFTASTFAAMATMTAAPALAATVEIASQGPVIELTVSENVTTSPDIVTIGAGVTTEARTAVEAMRQNSAEMRAVIDRIKSLGVDDKDIQTTGINLNARYDYNRQTQQQVFRGYQVSNRVSVKLREIDETGRVLDALVSAGATDLNGPSFSIEDDAAAKDEARKRAVTKAQERAKAYAGMLGYNGVKVLSISEVIRGSSPMPQMMMRAPAEESAEASAPVQPGQVSTGVNITIKFEMAGSGG